MTNKTNNEKYWKKRLAEQEEKSQEIDDYYLKQIDKELSRYQASVINDINAFYQRYADETGMSKEQAEKYLTDNERREFQNMNLARYEKIVKNPGVPDSLKSALGLRHRISRKEALLKEIELKSIELYGNTDGLQDYVYKNIGHVYADTRIDIAKGFKEVGVDFRRPTVQLHTVKNRLRANWNPKNLSETIWGQEQKLYDDMSKILSVGLEKGKSIDDMVDEIVKKTGRARERAIALVRTESNAFHAMATRDQLKAQAITKYKNDVTIDNRTSDVCIAVDKANKIYNIDDMVIGENAPPFHVKCRTIIVPAIDEEEEERWFEDVDLSEDELTLDEALDLLDKRVEEMVEQLNGELMAVESDLDKQYFESMNEADRLVKRANKIEPDITADMTKASKASRGTLVGVNNRIKNAETLADKILNNSLNQGISVKKASKGINDSLRYTTTFNFQSFVDDFYNMQETLEELGYQIMKVKNAWNDDSPYGGVTTLLKKGSDIFEMQYHTKESYGVKKGVLNQLMDEYKDDMTDNDRRDEIIKQMEIASEKVIKPENIGEIKDE